MNSSSRYGRRKNREGATTTMNNAYGYETAVPDSAEHARQDDDSNNKYGYGDAVPDSADKYGYGDVAPDSDKYGYGDAAPDAASSKYGYGDAAPDSATAANKYGYGEAAPDSASKYGYGEAAPDSASKYGYGEAAPDSAAKYGYGDAAPGSRRTSTESGGSGSGRFSIASNDGSDGPPKQPQRFRQGRRSSMKQSGAPRRSSISYSGEIQVELPGQRGKKVVRRTSISFADQDQVKEVTPTKELCPKPHDLWVSSDEQSKTRKKLVLLVDVMRRAKTCPEAQAALAKVNTRGLEGHVEEGPTLEQDNAWYSVFLEQHMQRNQGFYDEDFLSKVYALNTKDSQKIAQERAQQDAKDIEKYTRTTRRRMRRSSMF